MASCHAHINTFLLRLHAYYQMYSKASQFPGKGQCLYKRFFVHASVSVTLYIDVERKDYTRVCIVQVSHAHPPFAAAVFNCYQMYSKASHK